MSAGICDQLFSCEEMFENLPVVAGWTDMVKHNVQLQRYNVECSHE